MIPCAGISLREMLALPGLKNVRLIAGESGLDKAVTSVNIMEVPDIMEWTRAGELLLTTVYSIRHDTNAQSRLIPELAERKLAGLAIKPGRYIERTPDIMIEQANAYGFPLLEIPYDVSFPDIINPVLSEISNQQFAIIQRADEVHLHLNRVVLEGGNMRDIADVLVAALNNNAVIIQTFSNDVIVSSAEYNSEHQDIQKFIENNGRYGTGTGRGKVWIDGRETGYFRSAICVGKKWYGTITVLETQAPVLRADEGTIERTAAVAALVLVNQLAVASVEQRYYNEFLNELLIAPHHEEKNLKGRARGWGIDLQQPHVVAAICFYCRSNETEEEYQLIAQRIIQGLREHFSDIAVGYKLDCIIMFIPLSPGWSGKELHKIREKIKAIYERLVSRLGRVAGMECGYIGAGRPGSGLAGFQNSYREALQACQTGRKISPKEHICYYDDLGVWRLLGNIQDKKELQLFIEETLGKLLLYDQEKGAELVKTLEVYFECNGKLKKVTEKMYVHYNTILYRLDRIQQITGCSLEDSTACLNLQIALKLLQIAKE